MNPNSTPISQIISVRSADLNQSKQLKHKQRRDNFFCSCKQLDFQIAITFESEKLFFSKLKDEVLRHSYIGYEPKNQSNQPKSVEAAHLKK